MLIDEDNNQEEDEIEDDDSSESTEENKDSKEGENKDSKEGDSKDDDKSGDDDFEFEDDGKQPEDAKPADKKPPKLDENTEDDEDEDKKVIQAEAKKIVDEELKDFRAEREATRVASELNKLTSDYPELKKAEAKIKRYADHPSYKGKPLNEVAISALGLDVFLKIGASRAKKANEEASQSKGNGQGKRAGGDPKSKTINGIPSFIGKTAAEVRDITNKARAGFYNK